MKKIIVLLLLFIITGCGSSEIKDLDIQNNVYFRAAGTGNDFCNDIEENECKEVLINKYISI